MWHLKWNGVMVIAASPDWCFLNFSFSGKCHVEWTGLYNPAVTLQLFV
jgi:hypothetical protein